MSTNSNIIYTAGYREGFQAGRQAGFRYGQRAAVEDQLTEFHYWSHSMLNAGRLDEYMFCLQVIQLLGKSL